VWYLRPPNGSYALPIQRIISTTQCADTAEDHLLTSPELSYPRRAHRYKRVLSQIEDSQISLLKLDGLQRTIRGQTERRDSQPLLWNDSSIYYDIDVNIGLSSMRTTTGRVTT